MPILDKRKITKEIKEKYSIENNTFVLPVKIDPKDRIETEIGDVKQEDFYPQVKMKRWDNEVNFSVRLKEEETGTSKISFEKEKIIWSKGKIDIEYYDYPENEGGYKMVWYLKSKPITNKVEFSIQTKGLDFFYQPPLTQEYKNGYSEEFQKEIVVTETQVKDLEGNVLIERPENVVGSYAVYYQTKGGLNDINGKEYKAGKAFHIFRPKIIDSVGSWVWGKLEIDVEKGIYSIEIPQIFLIRAVYPIKSNDTFGYESAGVTSVNNEAWIVGSYYAASSAGTMSSITYYRTLASYAGKTKNAIYQYVAANNVGALYRTTNERIYSIESNTSWEELTLSSTYTISATTYFLVTWSSTAGGTITVYYDTGAGFYLGRAYDGTFPDPMTGETANTRKYSIYATYTPAGGGTAWNKDLSDTATPSDAISKRPISTKTDTITPFDVCNTIFTGHWTLNLTDSVSSTDNQEKSEILSKSDTATPSDSSVKSVVVVKSDTGTMSDSAVKTITSPKNDSVSPTDQITLPSAKSLNDSITPVDVATPTTTFVRSTDDIATISDAIVVNYNQMTANYMVYEGGKLKIIVNGALVQQYG